MIQKFMVMCVLVVGFILVPFVIMWHDHTGDVQTMVQDGMAEYRSVVPDWTDSQNITPDQAVRTAQDAILKLPQIMSGGWNRHKLHDYKESLYDVISAGMYHPSKLSVALQDVAEKYEAWEAVNEYFIAHRLYAMRHTF
jgi:hypothetical protein